MNVPLISFITPVYNNEKLILNTAASILNQTDDRIEYIIVDDGSTDNTPYIVDQIAQKDRRVKVIHQKNQWIYASFNNGIRAATGQYIYIVNSDDTLCENAYQEMVEIIEKYHPDVIWTKVLVHDADDEQNIIKWDSWKWDSLVTDDKFYKTHDEVRKNWAKFGEMKLSQNQANLYKRELMIANPFNEVYYGADKLFNISIARNVMSCFVMHSPVYNFYRYLSRGNTSIGKYFEYEHEMFNEIFNKSKELYDEFQLSAFEYSKLYITRMRQITHEIIMLKAKNCGLSVEEKLCKIFTEYIDDIIYLCAKKTDSVEELESRILSGIRELVVYDVPDKKSEYFFIYELLDSLLRYEKEEEDYDKIENAVYHPLNTYRVGNTFLQKLKRG